MDVRGNITGEFQFLCVRLDGVYADDVVKRVAQVEGSGVQIKLPGLYLGEVEDVVQNVEQ